MSLSTTTYECGNCGFSIGVLHTLPEDAEYCPRCGEMAFTTTE